METVEQIITDEQINTAWGNANFGSRTKREILAGALLKCASGYYTGHTAKQIVSELGLVTAKWTLTKLGKRYLFAAYANGVSV